MQYSAFTGKKQVSAQAQPQIEHSQNESDNYRDPLLQWPMRGLAYSNELGAALSEIAPTLGTLLWFPAMLYFGADFYDKYKNEQTSYNPDMKRLSKQVIFQLLASVILPTASVLAGQKSASAICSFDKSGLSLQSREEIITFLQKFASRRHLEKFKDDNQVFKDHFTESLTTKREKLVRSNKSKNPLQIIHSFIFKKSHPEAIALSKKDQVLLFADKQINQMFKIYKDLTNNTKPEEFTDKMWNKFLDLKNKYSADPDYKSTYVRDAAEDIILKFQNSQIRKAKMIKTIGGFITLGFAIKPIDNFVENVIIKKGVEPLIKKTDKRYGK